MKKGDLMRERILETAEGLFFEKGYDHTSVQDILDALKLSKGGFYHYFPTKESVMTEVCERQILAQLERIGTELSSARLRLIEKLNLILAQVNLLESGSVDHAALMLKTCYMTGDVRVRVQLVGMVCDRLRDRLAEVLAAGTSSGELYVRAPEQLSRIILRLAADADGEACRILAGAYEDLDSVLDVTAVLDAARDAVEQLIGAPHGSVTLFETGSFLTRYRQAAEILKRMGE